MDYVGSSTGPVEFIIPEDSYAIRSEIAFSQPIEYFAIRSPTRARFKVQGQQRQPAVHVRPVGRQLATAEAVLESIDVDISGSRDINTGLIVAMLDRILMDNVELVGTRDRHGATAARAIATPS